jgi:hypothetical protein
MAFSTINKSSLYQDNKTYLGSASAVTVTGLGFQPDLVWCKDRQNANFHCLVDAVRGVGKYLESDTYDAEVDSTTASISAFTSDGFTTGTANPANESASSSTGFISWNWKANGAGSANTDGSISSTVSANTTSGFSIVSYTGTGANATVGHGLGTVPQMIIVKNRSSGDSWTVGSHQLGTKDWTDRLQLENNSAYSDDATAWNDTAPTSSVFSIGTSNNVNRNTSNFIAYLWTEVAGFSKFGSYVGNNNADGAFVYTGFKPAFVMIKASSVQNWVMFDSKRLGYNVDNKVLHPNEPAAEEVLAFDILSNGFKPRTTDGKLNSSGQTYIYMAFGQPIISNSGVCATAR